eukprot:scaffold174518_cov31-Tisochrysis_lutea.AAC.10
MWGGAHLLHQLGSLIGAGKMSHDIDRSGVARWIHVVEGVRGGFLSACGPRDKIRQRLQEDVICLDDEDVPLLRSQARLQLARRKDSCNGCGPVQHHESQIFLALGELARDQRRHHL